MKNIIPVLLISLFMIQCSQVYKPQYVFSVKGDKTYLNDQEILLKGVRLSNALISDKAVDELINNLDTFAFYGLNSFSVYFQGSRFGDIKGYREDATLDPVYAGRMSRIIEAADKKGFAVLVGCLYWSTSKAKWDSWSQREADLAVANTVSWLKEHNYRNVFVDVDNEGMALHEKNFDNRQMLLAGKKIDNTYIIATNFRGDPPAEADIAIHHSNRSIGKPYAETEGSSPLAPGGYWGSYSKQGEAWNNGPDKYQYINIGVHSEEMKKAHIEKTFEHLDRGEGYMMASTWLQCVAPEGPNHSPGGYGTADDPGIRWWLEAIRERYGSYIAPSPMVLNSRATGPSEKWQSLFNGRDLSGWDTYLGPAYDTLAKKRNADPIGLNNDPARVFSVIKEDGENVIRISGENFGGISTIGEFENFHLQLQFKWGNLKWYPRKTGKMDSGIMYYATGPHGADGGNWMRSQELQIQEGDCGDCWACAGAIYDAAARKDSVMYIYDKSGELFTFSNNSPNGRRCIKSADGEKPSGEWNTVDLWCFNGTSIHMVNGVVNMVIQNSRQKENGKETPLIRGKIQIQSEGAEVFYRNIRITPITKLPEKI